MATCCVVLLKSKRFYITATYLKIKYPDTYSMLMEFLLKRREYIKAYLLEDSFPKGCEVLKRITAEAPLVVNSPKKTRLLELVFSKKLVVQSLYKKDKQCAERQKALTRRMIATFD